MDAGVGGETISLDEDETTWIHYFVTVRRGYLRGTSSIDDGMMSESHRPVGPKSGHGGGWLRRRRGDREQVLDSIPACMHRGCWVDTLWLSSCTDWLAPVTSEGRQPRASWHHGIMASWHEILDYT